MATILWSCTGVLVLALEVRTVLGATHTPSVMREVPGDVRMFDQGEAQLRPVVGAKEMVVIFGDYQCPYTKRMLGNPDWQRLLASKDISVQWRELPLNSIHPRARALACLSKQALLAHHLVSTQPQLLDQGSSQTSPIIESSISNDELRNLEKLVDVDVSIAHSLKLDATPLVFVVRQGKIFQASDLSEVLK